jgi:hypothetical protein
MIEALTNSKNHIMLKAILNLEGAQKLTKNEQKTIKGGYAPSCEIGEKALRCNEGGTVPWYWSCVPVSSTEPC